MQTNCNYITEFEMDYELTLNFFNQFWKNNLVIIYCGHFNDKSLISLTDIIGLHYELEEKQNKFKGRFVYLTVETFQNVIRYAKPFMEKIKLNGHKNFFFTKKIDDDFFISTANIVNRKSINIIKEKIKEVNNLNQKELSTKYKDVLLNKAFSEQGGAGLGFIEMGRKTKQNLEYAFEKITDETSIYYLFLKFLSPKSKRTELIDTENNSIQKIYKTFSDNNIILFIKHEFTQEVNEAIFRTTELNLTGENNRTRKSIFLLSVEALQNISKHAHTVNGKKDGIYYVRKENDDYIITTGNFIHYLDIETLKDFLTILKNTSKKDLMKLYRDSIASTENFDGNGGLGFIDIVRESKYFDFKFHKINDDYSLFIMIFKV